jgi:hypothetical protein
MAQPLPSVVDKRLPATLRRGSGEDVIIQWTFSKEMVLSARRAFALSSESGIVRGNSMGRQRSENVFIRQNLSQERNVRIRITEDVDSWGTILKANYQSILGRHGDTTLPGFFQFPQTREH